MWSIMYIEYVEGREINLGLQVENGFFIQRKIFL